MTGFLHISVLCHGLNSFFKGLFLTPFEHSFLSASWFCTHLKQEVLLKYYECLWSLVDYLILNKC